jgi:hypothetical protein
LKAAAVLVESDHITGLPYNLDCNNCPRSSTLGDPRCYKWNQSDSDYHFEQKEIIGQSWEVCPAVYLSDYRTRNLMGYFAAAYSEGAYNLDGWPDRFSAWVEIGLVELRTRVNKKREIRWQKQAGQ